MAVRSHVSPLLRFRNFTWKKQMHIAIGLARGAVWRLRGRSNGWPVVAPSVRLIQTHGVIDMGHLTKISRGVDLQVIGIDSQNPARLYIGKNTRIWQNTVIAARRSISIGADCAISFNCSILDSDMHQLSFDGETWQPEYAPVIIEDRVWIGCNVTVLKGVTIGRGAVIAAGSVVTRDIPPYTLAAGMPAKPIRQVAAWK